MSDIQSEKGGKLVRDTWIQWAKEQRHPKPRWLIPWEELSETDKEVDRRIFHACCKAATAPMNRELAEKFVDDHNAAIDRVVETLRFAEVHSKPAAAQLHDT